MTRFSQAPQRPVVRRHLTQEKLGAFTLVPLAGLMVVTGLAGQLTAVITDRGWPSWAELRINLLKPLIEAYAHPGDPMREWPGLAGQSPPPAVFFWTVYAALLAAAVSLAIGVYRAVGGGRSRPGFASRNEVAKELGAQALLKQAPRLRPQLARTTPRPEPTQLGTHLGRDVSTGIECYSSVRKSKFVVGPSESGKTSCVVIPEALDHDGPLLSPSSRADVMAATWKSRAERGRVWLFDPLQDAPGLPLLRWDPVAACVDPSVALNRAQALMSSVDMGGVSNGDSWKNRGQAVLRNLLHAAALDHKDIRTVLRWTYDQTNVEPATILAASPVTPENWAEMHYNVIRLPERQRAGYYMAVEGAMAAFEHPKVLETCLPTAAQQFDPHSLFDPAQGQSTVYLLAQADQAIAVADLLAALMDEVIGVARTYGQRSENNRLDPALKFLVDEAPNTATLKQLPSLVSDGGGRGIPTTMIVQERAQAVERWGANNAKAMWGAATVRMVLPGVTDPEELRAIASYASDYDEEIPQLSRSSSGSSVSYNLRTRSGLMPDEVRAIPKFHSLVLAAGGLRPVLTEMQPYFARSDSAITAASEKEFFTALNEHRSAL